jgi:hypothetical protein
MLTSTTTNQDPNDLQDLLHILNGKTKKTQSTTKSFRLDRDIVNKIDQQAKVIIPVLIQKLTVF